ncbi:hypothetical protein DAEQUDRAFT_815262 [Daedalea quercina L-15889]|uniref:Uncharacterized protein n=1 Tax=Daedalea quercina L-15889 TaxID=1314783 RepID=A0A165L7K2_9APHY|nr:hypothetical protein DAEQUDRAFT_815262 [Daedalea quercina L-15889]
MESSTFSSFFEEFFHLPWGAYDVGSEPIIQGHSNTPTESTFPTSTTNFIGDIPYCQQSGGLTNEPESFTTLDYNSQFDHNTMEAAIAGHQPDLPALNQYTGVLPHGDDFMLQDNMMTSLTTTDSSTLQHSVDMNMDAALPSRNAKTEVFRKRKTWPGTTATMEEEPLPISCCVANCEQRIHEVSVRGIRKHLEESHPDELNVVTSDGKVLCPWIIEHGAEGQAKPCFKPIAKPGLARHIATVHEKITQTVCGFCGNKLSRGDAKLRHLVRDCKSIPEPVHKRLWSQHKERIARRANTA